MGDVCIRNIPSRITKSGIHPEGSSWMIMEGCVYRRCRYAVLVLFVPLYGNPLASIRALGTGDGGPSRVSKSTPSLPCSASQAIAHFRYRWLSLASFSTCFTRRCSAGEVENVHSRFLRTGASVLGCLSILL